MYITKQKKPIWKDYTLQNYDSMTLWKKQNYGDSKDSWFLVIG